ncbi:hypothetical protein ACHAW6_014861 [Cyclotella cf. meneghiniana]
MEQKDGHVPLPEQSQCMFLIVMNIWKQGTKTLLRTLEASANFVVNIFDQKNMVPTENDLVPQSKNLDEFILASALHSCFRFAESMWSNVMSAADPFFANPTSSNGESLTPSREVFAKEDSPVTMRCDCSLERDCDHCCAMRESELPAKITLSRMKREMTQSTKIPPLEVFHQKVNFPRIKMEGKRLSKYSLKKHRRQTRKKAATIQADFIRVAAVCSPVKSELGETLLIKDATEYISRNHFTAETDIITESNAQPKQY